MTPRPVTTTRVRAGGASMTKTASYRSIPPGITVKRRKIATGLLGSSLRLNVVGNLADSLEFFRIRFWNLTFDLVLKLLFERHDKLDRVKRIGAEIVDK